VTTHHLKTIAIAAAALGMSAAAAKADILHYEAHLRGANEAPANASRAHGVVTAVLDTDRRALEYTVTYKDLSSPVTVAGFKEPTSPPDDPIVTAPSDPKADTIHDVVILTKAQVQDLNAGRWIFDISTSASPGGEIRGKVDRVSF
jgi:CHRD domain